MHDYVSYLVHNGVYITRRYILPLLDQYLDSKAGTASEMSFSHGIRSFFIDSDLTFLEDIILQMLGAVGRYDFLDAEVKLNFVRYGFLKGDDALTLQNND